ncbi:MAG: oxidative damage protection protein [Candidatus Dasytiphilus stammeri]
MRRIIFCKFLQREAEGQPYQIYPGKLGLMIYHHISKEAWSQWLTKQTILINEYNLNMLNIEDRKLLEDKMIQFLFKKKS